MVKYMMRSKKSNRWQMIDQSFLSLFVTFSIIQLVNRGSGIIDGVFVSKFLDADSIASVGIGLPAIVLAPLISSACQLDSAKSRVRKSSLVYYKLSV